MIKNQIIKVLGRFGYELARVSPTRQNDEWLRSLNIRTFIDIGAHVGEYIDFCRRTYPEARVYAFEPLADCCDLLCQKYGDDRRIHVNNYAVSDVDGQTYINKSSYAPSSSLLKMGALHKESFPESADHTLEPVEMRRLDGVFSSIPIEPDLFVKIDTQGFEDKVIEGGKKVLSQARIIQIETSFEILYENQMLFDAIYDRLKSLGFVFHGVKSQVCSPSDGTILQAHSYFLKE